MTQFKFPRISRGAAAQPGGAPREVGPSRASAWLHALANQAPE
jgi:hypothetical protein